MSRQLKINGKQVNPKQLNNWRTYRKKPVEIKAVRIGEPFEVETLEGTMHGTAGDWLVCGVKGELYPVKPDIFEQTYGREQTKIVPISCRDCGEKITVFAGSSANIIEVRCSKCTKEFQKKREEHNLTMGYTRSGETLSPLTLSGLADNGSFGLDYWLQGGRSEKTEELLRDGIAFCDYLINTKKHKKAEEIKEKINELQKTPTERLADETHDTIRNQLWSKDDQSLATEVEHCSNQKTTSLQ